jgi:hypothetical protein
MEAPRPAKKANGTAVGLTLAGVSIDAAIEASEEDERVRPLV